MIFINDRISFIPILTRKKKVKFFRISMSAKNQFNNFSIHKLLNNNLKIRSKKVWNGNNVIPLQEKIKFFQTLEN